MQSFRGELERFYAGMEDEPLVRASAETELTNLAREIVEAEITRRGLSVLQRNIDEDVPLEYLGTVTVGRYRDITEAMIARGVLESAGIYTVLRDENMVRMDWQLSNFIGGLRLQVAPESVSEATALLADHTTSRAPGPNRESMEGLLRVDRDAPAPETCPRCGSTDIRIYRAGRKLAFAALFGLSLPLPVGDAQSACQQCGLHWTDESPA